MLLSLHIEHMAVIRRVDVDFDAGLCVLTGETGAGKSLLIDSINCLLGGRTSRDLIRAGEDHATVSAVFSPPDEAMVAALRERGLEIPEGEELMLQRTIMRDGRARAFVNGRAVTQGMLRDIGTLLINIHGQNDNQMLQRTATHGRLLDDYDRDPALLAAYREAYRRFRDTQERMEALRQDESERLRTREMLAFQIGDIDAAHLKAGEEEKLTARRDRLLHLEKINHQVMIACRVLADGEKATVMGLCDKAESAVAQIAGVLADPEGKLEQLLERIASIRAEAEDIAEAVRAFGDEDVDDPTAEIDRLEGRLDVITRLSRKYGEGIPAILAFREKAAARLDELDTADDRLADLEAELVPLEKELRSLAARLTARRQASAASLAKAVMESLAFLDMPRVRFEVAVRPRKDFGSDGVDEVEFLIATNPGEAMGPLARIASGGELSRIMLAIRSVLNERDGVGTAIYDEVDAGISGRTARKVGIKLADIAERGAQVICVTHSAQIASLAGAHYVIEKQESAEEGGTRVETFVHRVSEEDRVEEIARILGGLSVTDTQREAARSLIRERTV